MSSIYDRLSGVSQKSLFLFQTGDLRSPIDKWMSLRGVGICPRLSNSSIMLGVGERGICAKLWLSVISWAKRNYNWEAVHFFWLKWPICQTGCLWQHLIAQKMTENRNFGS